MNKNYYKILSEIDERLDLDRRIDRTKYNPDLNDDDIKIPEIFSDLDWKNLIPYPPKNSSRLTQSELLEISRLTSNRTEQDVELILIVDKEPLELFYPILKKYSRQFPKRWFDNIYKDVYKMVMSIKNYYNRPRPEQLAEIYNIPINILRTKTHQTPSYPSGHTVYSSLAYHLIRHLYPNISDIELMIPVNQTGRARMLQGIHYRSDIDAALILTEKLFKYLMPKLGDYK